MDEVVYLEQDEEIPSVIDKLRNLEAKNVVLVVPKGAAVLQSVVNLKILKKEAENLEKEIALVTQDKIGRNLASQVGLSVYDSVESPRPVIQSAQEEPEVNETIELDMSKKPSVKPFSGIAVRDYQEEKSSLSRTDLFTGQKSDKETSPLAALTVPEPHPHITAKPLSAGDYSLPSAVKPASSASKKSKFKLIFATLLFLAALLLLYRYYPQAQVFLSLQSESYQKDLTIVVDNNINQPNLERSAIAGELQEAEKEVKENFSATGSKDIGEKASGTIKITNPTGDSHTIISGTEFKSSSGLIFLATESVTIPKATASVDALGNVIKNSGTATVKVQARESGESYNIAASSFTIIGNLLLSGENTSSMSGGSSKKVTIVSQDDINSAKDKLGQKISEENFQELKNKAGQQTINSNAISNDIVSFVTNKKVDEESDTFEASLKLKSRTLSFWEKDYRQMIVEVLSRGLASNQELILSASDEISTISSPVDYSTGTMNLAGTVKTNIVKKIDPEEIKKQLVNKKPAQAESQLKTWENVAGARINLRPSWWWKIPKNIEIKKEVK